MKSTKDEKKGNNLFNTGNQNPREKRHENLEIKTKNFSLEIIQTVVYLFFISSGKQLFYLKKKMK